VGKGAVGVVDRIVGVEVDGFGVSHNRLRKVLLCRRREKAKRNGGASASSTQPQSGLRKQAIDCAVL
jgi:hypothetical protein